MFIDNEHTKIMNIIYIYKFLVTSLSGFILLQIKLKHIFLALLVK